MSKVIQLSIPQEPEIDSGNLLVDDIGIYPMRIILINTKLTLDIPCMDMLRWPCKLNKRGKL